METPKELCKTIKRVLSHFNPPLEVDIPDEVLLTACMKVMHDDGALASISKAKAREEELDRRRRRATGELNDITPVKHVDADGKEITP